MLEPPKAAPFFASFPPYVRSAVPTRRQERIRCIWQPRGDEIREFYKYSLLLNKPRGIWRFFWLTISSALVRIKSVVHETTRGRTNEIVRRLFIKMLTQCVAFNNSFLANFSARIDGEKWVEVFNHLRRRCSISYLEFYATHFSLHRSLPSPTFPSNDQRRRWLKEHVLVSLLLICTGTF